LIDFFEQNNIDSEDFVGAISIYCDSIPAGERQEVEIIKQRVGNKQERMFIGRLCGKVVSFALVWPVKESNFVLIDYLAVREDCRNQEIASKLFELYQSNYWNE
jgi:predicted N-acetyltransferase YhbS